MTQYARTRRINGRWNASASNNFAQNSDHIFDSVRYINAGLLAHIFRARWLCVMCSFRSLARSRTFIFFGNMRSGKHVTTLKCCCFLPPSKCMSVWNRSCKWFLLIRQCFYYKNASLRWAEMSASGRKTKHETILQVCGIDFQRRVY